jgi:hypothetical protein
MNAMNAKMVIIIIKKTRFVLDIKKDMKIVNLLPMMEIIASGAKLVSITTKLIVCVIAIKKRIIFINVHFQIQRGPIASGVRMAIL